MKIQTNTDSSFPNQVVSDEVKASYDYGLQVSRAIEQEWFNQGRGNGNRYLTIGIAFTHYDYTQEVSNQYKNIKMSYL